MKVEPRTGAMEYVNHSQHGVGPIVTALMQEPEQFPTSKRRAA